MGKTNVDVRGEAFLINGQPTYSEISNSNHRAHGLLMNARFIQGIFDDKNQPERFARFGKEVFDADEHTKELIKALPAWYDYGLRAFTVGYQGGGPVFTIDDWSSIDNNPFGADGKHLDPAYENRMDQLIRAADELGMVVIVSYLYQAQSMRFQDGKAIRNAVETASESLRNGGYTNVIVEVANEHTVGRFAHHPIVSSAQGMAYLIELAKKESGMLVGCSGGGGEANREIHEPSDIIFIHGNNCTRQTFYNMIQKVRSWEMDKPIVCNEDSPCYGQLAVSYPNYVSWGYYNNLTKQEPPAPWGITRGEDQFFAQRVAEGIGIAVPEIPFEEQYYLQGFEPEITVDGLRWIRLASLYPETINYVDFFCNGSLVDRAYEEPFMIKHKTTWIQDGIVTKPGDQWKAQIVLRDGRTLNREATVV